MLIALENEINKNCYDFKPQLNELRFFVLKINRIKYNKIFTMITRKIHATGNLQSVKNKINVNLDYDYNCNDISNLPTSLNFNFGYTDNNKNYINVNGSFNVANKKITNYNVNGNAILSSDIMDDITTSVLIPVATDPINIINLPSASVNQDSSI